MEDTSKLQQFLKIKELLLIVGSKENNDAFGAPLTDNDLRQRLALGLSDEGMFRANVLQGVLQTELLNWLPECGFCSDDDALLTSDLDLASDLSKVLLWDLYPSLLAADDEPE